MIALADTSAGAGLHRSIPWLFLVAVLISGTFYALVLPPLQIPDEYGHLYRAYSVSTGSCRAPESMVVPWGLRELELLYPPRVELNRRITEAELVEVNRLPLQGSEAYRVRPLAVNLYSCVPYLPAAVGIRLGRQAGLSPVSLMYLGRLANLLAYTLIVFAALRVLPDLRLLLFCLALMPMSLQQAASLSPDSLTNASSFLLVALILSIAVSEGPIRWRDSVVLGAVVLVASLCKFNVWLVAPLLLIPSVRFSSQKRRWLWIGSMLLIACIGVTLWQSVNRGNIQQFQTDCLAEGINITQNLQFVYERPLRFLAIVGHSWPVYDTYLQQYAGRLGWLSVILPRWLAWLYLAILVLVAATQTRRLRIHRAGRALLAGVFAGFVISTFILLWGFEATQSDLDGALHSAAVFAPGVQGRYFIATSFLLYLSLAGHLFQRRGRYVAVLALSVVLLAVTIGAWCIWRSYYVDGPLRSSPKELVAQVSRVQTTAEKYEGQLVRRPGATAEDGKVYYVHSGEKHWVLDSKWITAHGFHWPDDVKVIPGGELDPLPLGQPIR